MDAFASLFMALVSVFLFTVPSALGRKCYQCDSFTSPGCADANQISQLYTDCSTGGGGYGSSFSGSSYQGGMGQPGQFGQGVGFPQAQGQVGQPGGFGNSYGSGYGTLDRCIKVLTVNPQMSGPVGGGVQGQPRVQRLCGSANGMQGDGCFWQGSMQVCTCNSNYCNGSSRLSAASQWAILLGSVTTVLSYLYRNSL